MKMPTAKHIIRVLVFEIVLGAVLWTVILLGRQLDPTWDSGWLIIVCVVVSLEGLISPSLVRIRNLRGGEIARFRLAEALVVLLAIRVVALIFNGQLAALPASFIAIEPKTAAAMGLGEIAWWVSVGVALELAALDEPPIIPPPVEPGYVSPVQAISGRFYGGGALLLFGGGVLAQVTGNVLTPITLSVLYFLPGMMLLVRLQFELSNKEWLQRRVKVSGAVGHPWVRFGIALVAIAALISLIMPSGALLSMINAIGLLLAIIWNWLGSLFKVPPINLPPPTLPRLTLPSPPPWLKQYLPPPAARGIDLSWLGTLLTWAVLVVIIVYIVRTYFKDYPNLFAFVRRIKLFVLLREMWAALWREVQTATQSIRDYLPTSLPALQFWRRRDRQNRYVHLTAQSPRDQIYYYYLSTLHRAAEQGIPRRISQTPYEYERILELPGAQEAFDALTQAFVEARYSTSPIDLEQAQHLRNQWRQVRQVLQQIKRDKQSGITGPDSTEP